MKLWIFAWIFAWVFLQPKKPWLVPTMQMKISQDKDARHPAFVSDVDMVSSEKLSLWLGKPLESNVPLRVLLPFSFAATKNIYSFFRVIQNVKTFKLWWVSSRI